MFIIQGDWSIVIVYNVGGNPVYENFTIQGSIRVPEVECSGVHFTTTVEAFQIQMN